MRNILDRPLRDIIAYLCLLAAGIFVASVGVVWLQNGAFVFAHFTWLESIIGWVMCLLALERCYNWFFKG